MKNTIAACMSTAAVATATLSLGPGRAIADGPCGQDYSGASACAVNDPSPSVPYNGSIVASDDTDYYVFYASAHTHLSIALTDTENPQCSTTNVTNVNCGDVDVNLYDATGNEVFDPDDQSSPHNGVTVPLDWSTILSTAGTYYLEVTGEQGRDQNSNPTDTPYSLSVGASPQVVWPQPAPPVPSAPPLSHPKPVVHGSPSSVPRLPTQLAGRDALQARPSVIAFTGDGTGFLGGWTGWRSVRHPSRLRLNWAGRLRWTSWTATRATATGAEWLDNGRPDDARGTFHPARVRLIASDPRGGVFQRLLIVSRHRRLELMARFQHGLGWIWS